MDQTKALTDSPRDQLPQQQSVPLPQVGEPLDGRHYIDVIEEQLYADQRPSREEQIPRHSFEQAGQK